MFTKIIISILLISLFCPLRVNALDSSSLASSTTMKSTVTATKSSGGVPLGAIITWPHPWDLPDDMKNDYVECNGSTIPKDSDLYKLHKMTKTPNLYYGNGYFLRAGGTPRTVVSDSLKSHAHAQKAHTHTLSGSLASTALTSTLASGLMNGQVNDGAITGTTKGQSITIPDHKHEVNIGYYDSGLGYDSEGHGYVVNAGGWATSKGAMYATSGGKTFNASDGTLSGSLTDESVSGSLTNRNASGNVTSGKVTGTALAGGDDDTLATGGAETAPMHFTTRYFMRINL